MVVYVKLRMNYSDERMPLGCVEVWGAMYAPPEGAHQVSPCLWVGEEDGMRFQYHGPVVVSSKEVANG